MMVETSWPTVSVLIVTYDRPGEIRETIRALQKHLCYRGALQWAIADDGSPEGYTQALQESFPELELVCSITPRKGWGGNVNAGMRMCAHTDFLFLTEDDYVTKRDIDLTSGVGLLQAIPSIGAVRYDGIAGHRLDLQLREATTCMGQVGYLNILRSSPSLNMYSNRPHLKSRTFHECYGTYAVGISLGATEDNFAHRVKDNPEGPGIACLANGIETTFDHIGKSRQGTELDVASKGT